MIYTNKNNLPAPICKVVTRSDYNAGDCDISVTTLIDSPRIRVLKNKHQEELVEDVSDCIYKALGTILHNALEEVDSEVTERRLFMKMEGLPGKIWTLSGAMDRYKVKGKVIQDYKLTTAWKFKGEPSEDFIKQLNIYAEILRYNNIEVDKLEIHGILRDWSKMQAKRDANYPQCQYVIQDIPLWPREQAQEYIKERVIAHQKAEEELPECSMEECWAKPPVYAVMKKGRKSAVKLYENQEAANTHATREGKNFWVDYRPPVANRCESYCPCANWCKQFKQTKENK